jgi:GNAT superfamily N-acetyltransferase
VTGRDKEILGRSVATLVESWAYLASGSPGAEVTRIEDGAIAAFPHPPDRDFLNNAVLARRPADIAATVARVEVAYARVGVERFAIWVHESEPATAEELRGRGYRLDTSTRTMAMSTADLAAFDSATLGLPTLEVIEPGLKEFWAVDGLDGLLPTLDPSAAHLYVARVDDEDVAMLMAFDHAGDCGIYMVGTVPGARRRGVATALSAHAVAAARDRGCTTASLQSTEMAERIYARVGFVDLGRWEEYVPG